LKQKFWKLTLPILITLVTLGFYGFYIFRNGAVIREFLNVSLSYILLLITLRLITLLINATLDYLFYRGLKIPIGFWENFGLRNVNTLANQLPFAGGLVASGFYLKRRFSLAYTRFLSATAAVYVSYMSANGVLGLVVLIILSQVDRQPIPVLLILGFCVMTVSVLAYWFPVDFLQSSKQLKSVLSNLVNGWQVLKENTVLLIRLILLQLIVTFLQAGRFYLAFKMLSQDIKFSHCLLISSATLLTRLASFAPGGLGIREGIVAAVGSFLGYSPAISALAVGIDRLVSTTLILFLGVFSSYRLGIGILRKSSGTDLD